MMLSWNRAFNRGLLSGTAASILSTVALLLLGRKESSSALAPVNAISHWYWGDDAIRRNRLSIKYTVPGYLTHHATSIFWAVLFERIFGRAPERSTCSAIAASATTAAVACFVDYQLTPKRLTPGFEHRLSRKALFVVYAGFAAGLALTAFIRASARGARGKRDMPQRGKPRLAARP
jgi:hypothetical protein